MKLRDTARNWQRLGELDPLFAVLTFKDKQGGKWDREDFFKTGEIEIQNTFAYISSLGLASPHGKALDFGCGVGRLTQALAEYFREVTGVDIASSMIELAQQYNRYGAKCRYYVHTANDLRLFPDRSFDFVYSKITLQHVEPRYAENYIKEFLRVLAPQGILFFQLPSGPSPFYPRTAPAGFRNSLKSFIPSPALTLFYRIKHHYHPVLEMHAIQKNEVVGLIESCGGKVLGIRENQDAGEKWISLDYCVTL